MKITRTSRSGHFDRRRERGSALLTAMFCIFVMALAAGSVAVVLNQEIKMNRAISTQAGARAIAAGGVEHVLAWGANWCAANPNSSLTAATLGGSSACSDTLGDGSYSVTVSDKGNNILEIYSTGTLGGVTADSRAYVGIPVNSLPALGYGIYANGSMGSNGNGSYTVGNSNSAHASIFARKGMTVQGKGYYGGTAQTSNGQVLNVNVKTGSSSYTSDIPMPVLDSSYYLTTATTYGEVKTAIPAAAFTSAGYTPAGGVLWINSSTQYSFSGNSAILKVNGVLVLNGGASLTFKGNGDLQIGPASVSTSVQPALIVLGGGLIDLGGNSGTKIINGAVYTDSGDVTVSGTAGALANIISGGNVSINGGGNGDVVSAWGPTDPTHFIVDTKIKLLFWER